MFTLTLSADDLESLRGIVRATDEHPLLLAKLYKVRAATKPRKPAKPVAPFNPSTGNAALDDFMRAHHDPNYKPAPLPKGKAFPPSVARGGDKRPVGIVLAEAIDIAKSKGWPGSYSGNFATPKRGK